MGKFVIVAVICVMIFFVVAASMGCNRLETPAPNDVQETSEVFERREIKDQPPREFKEKCEITYKAFHIFKFPNGQWACKLDDGRVFTEDDIK